MRTHLQIGALAGDERLDLGPQHPTRAGLVDLWLDVDDAGLVTAAQLQPGYLHRGAEKLFEVRDYRQVLMLADRHDWQAPFSGELGAALVCEHLWGLQPPPRAVVLRTLLAEMARAISHLGFLSFVGALSGDDALAAWLRTVRERARVLMLELSGNRLHPMLNRLGGLSEDATPAWLDALVVWFDQAEQVAGEIDHALLADPFTDARGVGVLTTEQAEALGVSGPAARALGLPWDLRRRPGYLHYPELDFDVATPDDLTGDAVSRLRMLVHEVHQSASLARQCRVVLDEVDGPVSVKLAKIIRLPDAEARLSIEAPWGVAGFHLVSRGDRVPWRLALRTPTFANAQALQHALLGTPREWVDVVVASLAWTTGDLDK
ncbi:NADH-quinone oxidoreductase subunit D-related protein [Aestuariimicrobium ganziense]|uniref:NADH-quinone oxidoreductase subunit D-related protein n=1 Tax=Aestuariimicrobium ganziense TaxID=2773677 RepID=UPI0019414E1E|nr:NADH-quinone oxidoreductase subunit D [Aestuariimicrobium ganziense]